MVRSRRRLLFVVNADWFFLSHRLPLARAAQAAGFEVGVCAGDTGSGPKIEAAGMRFFPLRIERGGTRPREELRTVADLGRVYLTFRPDIVHHVTIKPVLYGSMAARALGVRGIVNAVSGLGYVFIPRTEDRLPHRLLRRTLWAAYRVALDGKKTRVIFQNDDDRATFVGRKLVDRSRAALVRGSGVDLTRYFPTPLPEGPFTFLVPARLLWDKGVGEFVEAATRLKVRHPTVRFVLLGRVDPGNPAAIDRSRIDEWVASGAVEWWGELEHDAMPATLARAHVVVLPSYREGLPLAMVEAAACGRPGITTDVPGCRDVVVDGETGFLVPERDAGALEAAMERALTMSRTALVAMGEAGARLARERFSLDAVIAQTLALYRDLLGT
ncbi:MAG TPA: glycosyltransferase family 4 protein [Polyangiaceae bacterium]|nr:glycosyltransferase family 4 protein [Polyangiaceae bacterium]